MPNPLQPDGYTDNCMCRGCRNFRLDNPDEAEAVTDGDESVAEFECEQCGDMQPEGEEYHLGGIEVCRSCYGSMYECEWCNQLYDNNNRNVLWINDMGRDVTLCGGCRHQFYYCAECDCFYTEDYPFWAPEVCMDCYEGRSDRLIHDWNYRPTVQLIDAKGKLQPATYYLGLELETDHVQYNDVAQSVDDLTDNLYCKSDGSLDHGVEIVSHPGSLEAWQNGDVIPWSRWASQCTPFFTGMRDVGSAGIHIHVSRTAFERRGKWSASHLWKFMQLHYRNERAFQLLAGRDGHPSYAAWNASEDRPETTEKAKPHHGHQSDRYRVINVNNEATVELRYFQADERKETILSDLELVHAAVEYTRTIPAKGVRLGLLDFKYFRAWYYQRKGTYPNLCARTSKFPQIIKHNRTTQQVYMKETARVKEISRQRNANERPLYEAVGIAPPRNRDQVYYAGIDLTNPSRLRASLYTEANVGYWHNAIMYGAPSVAHVVGWITRDLATGYTNRNAQLRSSRYDYSVIQGRDEHTAIAWHVWDIIEAIRERTTLITDDNIDEVMDLANTVIARV